MEPYNLIAQWTGWPVIVAIMLAKLCLKPTGEIGHGLTRMHTDETELIYQCFSVFVRVQNLASFVKDSTYDEPLRH
jgi:hypothetical protein